MDPASPILLLLHSKMSSMKFCGECKYPNEDKKRDYQLNRGMSDRISELSDDLLCKILCYLPNTKHAAATFFLSKRWKSVWLKLPSLYFEDEDYINHAITPVLRNYKTNYTSRFAQFVNSILSVDQPIIKKFRLKCKLIKPRPSDFTRWINTAIQRNVEELDIFLFSHRRGTTLPIDVFTCTKLVVLKLRGVIIEDKINSVCLPSLRILSLKGVGFSSEDCVVKLLSCSRKTLENVLFSGLSNIWPKYILDVAPADTPSFHNLITLNISLVSVINWEHVLMRLIQNSPKLQNLSIEKGFKLNGGEVDSWNQPQNNVPGCISSHLRTCFLRGFYSQRDAVYLLPFAKYIIKNASVLQIMTIYVPNPHQRIMQLMSQEISSCRPRSPTCTVNLEEIPTRLFFFD